MTSFLFIYFCNYSKKIGMLFILSCYLCQLCGENVSAIFVFSSDTKSSSHHSIFVGVSPLAYTYSFSNWQGVNVDDLETNHIVLVHGGGFGAWCWYKSIALLEESGYKVAAIDLTGSGVSSFDTNIITSLSQYVKPLTDFLEKLPEGKKVCV